MVTSISCRSIQGLKERMSRSGAGWPNKESWVMPIIMLTATSNRTSAPHIKEFLRMRGPKTEVSVLDQPLRDIIKDTGFFHFFALLSQHVSNPPTYGSHAKYYFITWQCPKQEERGGWKGSSPLKCLSVCQEGKLSQKSPGYTHHIALGRIFRGGSAG